MSALQDRAFATNTNENKIYELDLDERELIYTINMTLDELDEEYQCVRRDIYVLDFESVKLLLRVPSKYRKPSKYKRPSKYRRPSKYSTVVPTTFSRRMG